MVPNQPSSAKLSKQIPDGMSPPQMQLPPDTINADELDTFGMEWYRYWVPIEARQMNEAFAVTTPGGVKVGGPTDWLTYDPVTGQRDKVSAEDFERRFERLPEDQKKVGE